MSIISLSFAILAFMGLFLLRGTYIGAFPSCFWLAIISAICLVMAILDKKRPNLRIFAMVISIIAVVMNGIVSYAIMR